MPILVTIPLSHYCERARWALDWAEIDYVERQHLQFFSWSAGRRAGGTFRLPVLQTDTEVLADSSDIVGWASSRAPKPLRPQALASACLALESKLAGEYGDAVRRASYGWFFENLDACLPYNFGAAPRWQEWTLRLGRPAIVPYARRYIKLSPTALERARDAIGRTMDEVAADLEDGRRYLLGADFTAADLTFAALSGPVLLPSRYGMPLPPIERLDPATQAWISGLREHPAGAFALRLYAERPAVRARLDRPISVPRT